MQKHVIAITGAFGVLGSAVTKAFAARGAQVALIDHAPTPAGAPGTVDALHVGGVDLADPAAAERAVTAVLDHFGRLDVLVNIAGGFRWETLSGGRADTWDAMYAMNLKSAVNACRAALDALVASGRGRIVNVGAAAALKAGAGMGAYAASKAGVAKLTEALAEELKDRGVTVNAVLPSILDTPGNRRDMPDADFSRWVSPDALASVIAFLASEDAAAITGACIPVTHRC